MSYSASSSWNTQPAFWEFSFTDKHLASWLQTNMKTAVATAKIPDSQVHVLASNLVRAVVALKVVEREIPEASEPDEKRKKKNIQRFLKDPFNIWFQGEQQAAVDGLIPWNDDQDDLPEKDGGKLTVLSVGGLLNGMTAQIICKTSNINPIKMFKQAVTTGMANTLSKTFEGATLLQLHDVASLLQQEIARIVNEDVRRTTPQRIHELLAGEMSEAEFSGIRKRVYDTVILGRGLHQGDNSDSDLPTASASAVHDVEKLKKCSRCGNNDQADFVLDRKNGDVICSHCGLVVAESIMHEGSQFRKFEGEVDRNHHGDAANPLYSNAHNMGTSLSGVAPTTGAGIGGWGSASGGNLETVLKNAHAYTELNVSQFGKTDRRTRIGYKDRQKKEAFTQMTHAGDSLNLHEAVVQRAKELFAGFRDDRELVQQFKGVLAACLCEAFEELSSKGKHILRQQQQQHDQQNLKSTTDGKPAAMSARAIRRSELHNATMAGKGGLVLNESQSTKTVKEHSTGDGAAKAAAQWDIEDCRTWLLAASRTIAQTWISERSKNVPASKKIPSGSLDELEGRLVGHAITLCEQLEIELQQRNNKSTNGSRRVVTPRVTDMSKLGIKWQHKNERGSGGKGGVGGSGTHKPAGEGRTAGQILLLKTAKKLGVLLKDPVAGEAIHQELRNVIGKQEARKRKALRDEATRQRFNQMQRKPWLQARLQQEQT